jgi:hypothetical protein
VRRQRNRVWPLAALAFALAAALRWAPELPAHPPALTGKSGKQIYGKRHKWLHQSKMPLVNGSLRLITGACPGRPKFSGCIFLRRPRTLYMRPGGSYPKGVLYHELGHSFDLTLMRPRDRSAFKRTLKLRGSGWFTGDGPPAELFAEGYALCSRFGVKRPAANELGWTGSVYGYRPSRTQHRMVCEIIAAAGAKKRQRGRPKPQPAPDTPPVVEQKPPQPANGQPGGPTLIPGVPGGPVPLP